MTIEDIIEEIIGDFTTQAPDGTDTYQRGADGTLVVDGLAPLRTLNRKLGTHFPVDGPKTLNGLILAPAGGHPRRGHARRSRRADARGAADAGPRRKSRAIAGARRAGGGPAFTKRGRAGIIGRG